MRRFAAFILAVPAAASIASGCKGSLGAAATAPVIVTVPEFTLAPAEEDTGTCVSYTFHNDQPLYVNTVISQAGPGWHHSNWLFVPDTMYAGPDGSWPCQSRNFDELTAGSHGGVLFAQSTQSQGETQAFPAGAVMKIPAHSKAVAGIHLINASASSITTTLTLTLISIPESEVTVKLQPMSMTYDDIYLAPNARTRLTGNCAANPPLDFKVYYVLPHYHAWGQKLTLSASGPLGDVTIFDGGGSIGDPWGKTLDPPIDVNTQTSVSFSCDYDNTTNAPLTWENSVSGEMCVLLAYTDSPFRWVGGVLSNSAMVGTDGTGEILMQGPCTFGSL